MLFEAEGLALRVIVLRIKDLGDNLRKLLFLQGIQIAALAEEVHVQMLGGSGSPQAKGVYVLGAVACDGYVVGYCFH